MNIKQQTTTKNRIGLLQSVLLAAILLVAILSGCSSTKSSPTKPETDNASSQVPRAIMPEATCETVKEKFEGKRWEQAHLVCNLKDPSWSPK